MNKLNSLQILGITFLLALFMFYLTLRTEGRIADAAAENGKTERLGKQISQMKTTWADPKKSQQRIDRLLSSPVFKSYVTKTEKTRNVYRARLQGVPAEMADRLTTRLLNEPVALKQIQIARNGDENISISVEFSL